MLSKEKTIQGRKVAIAGTLFAGASMWTFFARTLTDYWNPIRQISCVNQIVKCGELEWSISSWKWEPEVFAIRDLNHDITFYDIPKGNFYFNHKNKKFYYEP